MDSSLDGRTTGRAGYSRRDKVAMTKFLIDRGLTPQDPRSGAIVTWREAAAWKITPHSCESMRNHFRRSLRHTMVKYLAEARCIVASTARLPAQQDAFAEAALTHAEPSTDTWLTRTRPADRIAQCFGDAACSTDGQRVRIPTVPQDRGNMSDMIVPDSQVIDDVADELVCTSEADLAGTETCYQEDCVDQDGVRNLDRAAPPTRVTESLAPLIGTHSVLCSTAPAVGNSGSSEAGIELDSNVKDDQLEIIYLLRWMASVYQKYGVSYNDSLEVLLYADGDCSEAVELLNHELVRRKINILNKRNRVRHLPLRLDRGCESDSGFGQTNSLGGGFFDLESSTSLQRGRSTRLGRIAPRSCSALDEEALRLPPAIVLRIGPPLTEPSSSSYCHEDPVPTDQILQHQSRHHAQ